MNAPAEPPPQTRLRKAGLVLVVIAGLAALLVMLKPHQQLVAAREWLAQLGPWAPVMFVLLYVTATVLLVPGSALTLAAGVLFGVVRGTLLVSLAATLGATAAFLVGRHLARNRVEQRLKRFPQFDSVQTAVAREGWKVVLLTRLSPVFPFTLLNYAFGLTRVSLRDYVLASWLGMLPGTVLYVYLGSLSGVVVEAAGNGRHRSPLEWTLLAVGLLATVAATVFVTRLARRALKERVAQP